MLDILGLVGSLNRPSLLVRTARIGVESYRRATHLGRILETVVLPRPGAALVQLMEIEAELEECRVAERGDYTVARHVDVLIAIMGEARLLRASTRPTGPAEVTAAGV